MISCDGCGVEAPEALEGAAPLTWTVTVEDGARHHTCETCSRAHLRSIEAKLERTWW